MTQEEHLQKALDTLAELCDTPAMPDDTDTRYSYVEALGNRRRAAEEILSHYRDENTIKAFKEVVVTLNVNGAIPVRPMTRFEMENSK